MHSSAQMTISGESELDLRKGNKENTVVKLKAVLGDVHSREKHESYRNKGKYRCQRCQRPKDCDED
jgi:hypothetical protein